MAAEVVSSAPAAAPSANTRPATTGNFRNTALYVGDLAPEVNEAALFEVFNGIAPVSTIRICRDTISRQSLGYAYVNFHQPADAERALAELNYTLIKGKPCRVMWSQRDPSARRSNVGNIVVKKLGPEITAKELSETLRFFGNILSCKVATDEKGVSKGYAFVHFETEADSNAAISGVSGMNFGGRTLVAETYVPRTMRQGPEWNNVYVKNIPKEWDEKAVLEFFTPCGEVTSSLLPVDTASNHHRGFGFVCFKTHIAAEKAAQDFNGKEVEGTPASSVPHKPGKGDKGDEVPAGPRKLKLYVGRAQKKSERERLLRERREADKREKQARFANCNLYVRNLDESIDDEALRKEFSQYGTITSARVEKDKEGRSKLFGYVCFSTADEAAKALQGARHKLLQGKPLYVTLWQSREQRRAEQASTAAGRTRGAAKQNGAAPQATASAAAQNQTTQAAQLVAMQQALAQNPMLGVALMQLQQISSQLAAAQVQNRAGGAPNPQAQTQQAQLAQQQNMIQQYVLSMLAAAAQRGPGGAAVAVPAGARPAFPAVAGAPAANPLALIQQATAAAAAAANPAGQPAQQAQQPSGGQARNQSGNNQRRQQPAQAQQPAAGGAWNTRVASGPAGGAARGPSTTAAPTTAARVVAGQRTAASVVAQGTSRPGGAGAMTYNAVARGGEVPAESTVTAAVPKPVAAVVPAEPLDVAALAKLDEAPRRRMIGELLYKAISIKHADKASKLTGMLLEAMDPSDLVGLLVTPAELDARVGEALTVLQQHEAAAH